MTTERSVALTADEKQRLHDAAWARFARMPSSNPGDVAFALEPTVAAIIQKRIEQIAADIETEVGALVAKSTLDEGYDCCGCATYDDIVEHCLRIVREESDKS